MSAAWTYDSRLSLSFRDRSKSLWISTFRASILSRGPERVGRCGREKPAERKQIHAVSFILSHESERTCFPKLCQQWQWLSFLFKTTFRKISTVIFVKGNPRRKSTYAKAVLFHPPPKKWVFPVFVLWTVDPFFLLNIPQRMESKFVSVPSCFKVPKIKMKQRTTSCKKKREVSWCFLVFLSLFNEELLISLCFQAQPSELFCNGWGHFEDLVPIKSSAAPHGPSSFFWDLIFVGKNIQVLTPGTKIHPFRRCFFQTKAGWRCGNLRSSGGWISGATTGGRGGWFDPWVKMILPNQSWHNKSHVFFCCVCFVGPTKKGFRKKWSIYIYTFLQS